MMVLTFVLSQCFIVKLLTKPILLRIFGSCRKSLAIFVSLLKSSVIFESRPSVNFQNFRFCGDEKSRVFY